MRTNFALKTIADIFLYFSFVSMFWYFQNAQFLFIGAIILIGTGCYLGAYLSNKKLLRLVGLIPVLCALALPTWQSDYLVIAAPVIYGVITVVIGSVPVDYWKYLMYFKVTVIGEVCLWLFCLVAKLNVKATATYGMTYIMLAILVLNLVRYNANMSLRGKMIIFGFLFIPGGVSIVVGFVANFITAHGTGIWEKIFLPLGYLFQKFIGVLVNAGDAIIPKDYEVTDRDFMFESTEAVGRPSEELPEIDVSNPVISNRTKEVIIAFLILIGILLVAIVVIKLIKGTMAEDKEELEKVEEGEVVAPSIKRNRLTLKLTNQQKIRRLYRKYIKSSQKKGFFKSWSSTSMDVYEGTKHLTGEETGKAIREKYIKARYSEHDISDAEVKETSKLIKNIGS